MTKKRLIVFTGQMGSGKSTAIKCLDRITNKTTRNVKFAQTLYDLQEEAYSRISSVYTRPPEFKKDRVLLQFLGSEWGRNLDIDIWVKLWKVKVQEEFEFTPHAYVTCDDLRYDNEAKAVKDLGGLIVKLESNQAKERVENGKGIAGHASENGIDYKYIDYVVENNSTIDELEESLLAILLKEGLFNKQML